MRYTNYSCKVKRRGDAPLCCGIEYDKVYEAMTDSGGHYVRVKLPDGEWTSDHWCGGLSRQDSLFIFVEKPNLSQPDEG